MNATKVLISFLNCAFLGTPLKKDDKNLLNDEMLSAVYSLAKKHDMAHLLNVAFKKNDITPFEELNQKLNEAQAKAVNRYLRIDMDKERILHVLNENGIDHIPLKGAVIRELYPEQWMRTSCDIDILIKPEDIEAVKGIFFDELGFKPFAQTSNRDISFATPNGVHIELHYTLLEDENQTGDLLEKVWEYSSLSSGKKSEYQMAPEFFITYIISHAARHITVGGCGIRPFYDLYFILNKMEYDEDVLNELLEKAGLKTFFGYAKELMMAWIKGYTMSETVLDLQAYILSGGTYGSYDNYIKASISSKGGKKAYLYTRIFMPLEDIKNLYPNVVKRPWLLNWYRLCRLCRALFSGKAKRGIKEAKRSIKTSEDNTVGKLIDKLELR